MFSGLALLLSSAGALAQELDSLWLEAQRARFFNRWADAYKLALQVAQQARSAGELDLERAASALALEAACWTGREGEALHQVPAERIRTMGDSALVRRWFAAASWVISAGYRRGEGLRWFADWEALWEESPQQVRRWALEVLSGALRFALISEPDSVFHPQRADLLWALGGRWAKLDRAQAILWQSAALRLVGSWALREPAAEQRLISWLAQVEPEGLRTYLLDMPDSVRSPERIQRALAALRSAGQEGWAVQVELSLLAPSPDLLLEGDSAAVAYWAERYLKAGRHEEALSLWTQWARKRAQPAAYRKAARWLLAQGHPEAVRELLAFLEQPGARLRGQGALVLLLAEALRAMGQPEQADRVLAALRAQDQQARRQGAITAAHETDSSAATQPSRLRGLWRLFLGILGLLPR